VCSRLFPVPPPPSPPSPNGSSALNPLPLSLSLREQRSSDGGGGGGGGERVSECTWGPPHPPLQASSSRFTYCSVPRRHPHGSRGGTAVIFALGRSSRPRLSLPAVLLPSVPSVRHVHVRRADSPDDDKARTRRSTLRLVLESHSSNHSLLTRVPFLVPMWPALSVIVNIFLLET